MNKRDPSGHGAVFGMFGIVLGAIIMAWGGIERATGNESKSNVLLGIGGGIIAFSVFGTITGSMKGSRTMRRRIDRPNGIALTERRGHI